MERDFSSVDTEVITVGKKSAVGFFGEAPCLGCGWFHGSSDREDEI